MNIMKLQSQLQQVPDNALIGYVQNPDGQVPSYLALAELSRRKEIRKSTAPQEQAPMQSVAEQAVAEATPGIAGIPMQDPTMFSEQSMAGGGIIAFEEGGDVPSFAGPRGSYVVGPDPDDLLKSYRSRLAGEEQRYAQDRPEYGLGQITSYAQHQNALAKLEQGTKTPYDPAIKYYDSIGNLQGKMMAQQQRANWLENPSNLMENAVSATPAKPVVANPAAGQVLPDRTGNISADSSAESNLNPKKTVKAPIAERLTYTDIPSADSRFDALKRPELSARDYMAEMQGLVGENEGLAALKNKLAGMESKAAKEEEQAPWMALAKAGFAMASGKSQNALQNIAEGAGVGIGELAASKERLAAKEEKRFALQTQMAQAERAEQLASAKYGADSAQADKARNDALGLAKAKASLDVDITNTSNKLKVQEANVNTDLKEQQLALQRLELNKPSSEIQLLNWLKNPKNAALYNSTIGATKTGALTDEDWLAAYTKAGGQVGTGMTLGQYKNSVAGTGTTDYTNKYGLSPRSTN